MKGAIRRVDKDQAFEMARQFFGSDNFTYHEESELFDNYIFTYDVAELVIEKFYNAKWSRCPFGKFNVNDAAAGYVEFVDGIPSKQYKLSNKVEPYKTSEKTPSFKEVERLILSLLAKEKNLKSDLNKIQKTKLKILIAYVKDFGDDAQLTKFLDSI